MELRLCPGRVSLAWSVDDPAKFAAPRRRAILLKRDGGGDMLGQVVPLAAPLTGRVSPELPRGEHGLGPTPDSRTVLVPSRGFCRPLGATARPDGVNFAVCSRHA